MSEDACSWARALGQARASRPQIGGWRFGDAIAWRAESTSTMDDASQAAPAARSGAVFGADRQSAGRGARGARWSSGQGQLMFSLLLKDVPHALATLRSGLAIARAVDALTGSLIESHTGSLHRAPEPAQIKWPNDVWVQGAKISGILAEARAIDPSTQRAAQLILGVGLNRVPVPAHALEEGAAPATSLSDLLPELPSLSACLSACLDALEDAFELRPAEVIAAVEARLLWRGEQVSADEHQGELVGLASDGALRLRRVCGGQGGREQKIHAGRLRRI